MTKQCTLPIFNPLVFKEQVASFLAMMKKDLP
jgi:hypothetical protein